MNISDICFLFDITNSLIMFLLYKEYVIKDLGKSRLLARKMSYTPIII